MFLNQLTMLEKESFISLSIHAAKANGIFADEEYAMLEEYCKEMGIAFFDANNVKSLEQVFDVYKDSDEKNKKIVLFEILGLLFSDGAYDDLEKKFAIDFAEKVGLSKEIVEMQTELLIRYLDLVKEIGKVIL